MASPFQCSTGSPSNLRPRQSLCLLPVRRARTPEKPNDKEWSNTKKRLGCTTTACFWSPSLTPSNRCQAHSSARRTAQLTCACCERCKPSSKGQRQREKIENGGEIKRGERTKHGFMDPTILRCDEFIWGSALMLHTRHAEWRVTRSASKSTAIKYCQNEIL